MRVSVYVRPPVNTYVVRETHGQREGVGRESEGLTGDLDPKTRYSGVDGLRSSSVLSLHRATLGRGV